VASRRHLFIVKVAFVVLDSPRIRHEQEMDRHSAENNPGISEGCVTPRARVDHEGNSTIERRSKAGWRPALRLRYHRPAISADGAVHMDRMAAMTTFVKVVEAGSLSAAARSLDLSLPSVSRQLDGLEEHLGTRLLVRTTRHLTLTEGGRT
jgi:hypothetical protein